MGRQGARCALIGQLGPGAVALDKVHPVKATALQVVLLTGQRPGAVAHMRYEHMRDGWWEMPGEFVPNLD